ncbi:hypothetical protein AB0J83_33580 [Actinoplanes sp. NPDC049596]|uniref:hypothetical protein n=1 Tax=unclassified Actinoplanes TaxID=2626549 RepID=UPI00343E51B1
MPDDPPAKQPADEPVVLGIVGARRAKAQTAEKPAGGSPAAAGSMSGETETVETPVGDKAGFRLAAFGAVLIVVLFAGYGLGRLNNSTASASAPPTAGAGTSGADGGMQGMPGMGVNENQPHVHNTDGTVTQGGATSTASPMGAAVGGLSLSSAGLTLVPKRATFEAGKPQRLSFQITGAGGAAVTTYEIVHDKPLHLIVLRRDLSGFQHLHPTMASDGTWSIDLTLAQPGIYRMIADFTAVTGGRQIAATLGADLTVAGDYTPTALPAPGLTAETGGFRVAYEGKPDTKSTQPILMTVTGADGRPAKLDPYLGAFGHLVVMREGDLAYVHVHPETQLVDGKVKFWLALPSAGNYRMFLDFQVAGTVHTAAWTVKLD